MNQSTKNGNDLKGVVVPRFTNSYVYYTKKKLAKKLNNCDNAGMTACPHA